MPTTLANGSVARRLSRVFRTVVLIVLFGPMVLSAVLLQGYIFFPPRGMLADAVVLNVADARPNARGERRVQVTFEYLAEGQRHVRTRRVRTNRVVNIGDRISVRYRKERPERATVVSLRSPEPVPVATQRNSDNPSDGFVESWLIWLVALPFMAWGGYMFFRGGAGATDGKPSAARPSSARQTAAKPQAATLPAARERRPERKGDEADEERRERKRRMAATAMPKRKSKVVQRASWF